MAEGGPRNAASAVRYFCTAGRGLEPFLVKELQARLEVTQVSGSDVAAGGFSNHKRVSSEVRPSGFHGTGDQSFNWARTKVQFLRGNNSGGLPAVAIFSPRGCISERGVALLWEIPNPASFRFLSYCGGLQDCALEHTRIAHFHVPQFTRDLTEFVEFVDLTRGND